MALLFGFLLFFFGSFVFGVVGLDILTTVALLKKSLSLEVRMVLTMLLVPFNGAGIACGALGWIVLRTVWHWIRKGHCRLPMAREPNLPSKETGRITAASFSGMWPVILVLAVIVWLSTTAAFATLYWESRQTGEQVILVPVLNVGGILPGLIAVVWLTRRVLAMRFLHLPELGSDQYPLPLGKRVTLQFFQRRKRPCEVTTVSAQITCHGDETNCENQEEQSSHRVVLWEDEGSFEMFLTDEANETITGTMKLRIPDNLPQSSYEFEWTIVTITKISGRPPYHARFVIEVK